MTPQHHSADGNPVPLRWLLVGTTVLPAAAFGLMMAFAPEASADIEYQFSPGATLTFTDGNIETLTGTFSFNPAGPSLTQVDITLTGGTPMAGTYTNPYAATPDSIRAYVDDPLASFIEIVYLNDLGPMPDPIASAIYTNPKQRIGTVMVSGSAAPVPEPSSMAILGAALGLFGLRRCKSQRDLSAPADQSRPT